MEKDTQLTLLFCLFGVGLLATIGRIWIREKLSETADTFLEPYRHEEKPELVTINDAFMFLTRVPQSGSRKVNIGVSKRGLYLEVSPPETVLRKRVREKEHYLVPWDCITDVGEYLTGVIRLKVVGSVAGLSFRRDFLSGIEQYKTIEKRRSLIDYLRDL